MLYIHKDEAPGDVWKQFYGDEFNGTANEIYLYNVLFQSMPSGSIEITKDNYEFLHSMCIFYKCSKDDYGGAIHFECRSSIVQHRFCTINTYSIRQGFHSYTKLLDNDIDRQNYIIESTISECRKQDQDDLIVIMYGNIGIFSSNISKNNASQRTCYALIFSKSLSVINFSTFEENYAALTACLSHEIGNYEVYKCNIVKNSVGSSDDATIYSDAEVTLRNCTILGPYGNGKPFIGPLSIVNCHVDNIEFNSERGGTLSTSGIIFTDLQNNLAHFSTYKCEAKIRLVNDVKNGYLWEYTCVNNYDSISIIFCSDNILVTYDF